MRCEGALARLECLRAIGAVRRPVTHSSRTPTDSTPPGEDLFRPTVLKILELAGTTGSCSDSPSRESALDNVCATLPAQRAGTIKKAKK